MTRSPALSTSRSALSRRLGAGLLTACIATALLPAPAAAAPHPAPSAEAASLALPGGDHPVLDRIRSRGKVVLAHRESSVPFSYVAEGKPVGYALDLCQRIVERVRKQLGLKTLAVDYLLVKPADRIAAVAEGRADMECGSTTNNAERRQKVAFTVPHYITGARIAVRADSPYQVLENFEGHALVSTTGTTPLKAVEAANRDRLLRVNVLAAPDHAKALDMVAKGEADGFAMDDVLLYGLIASQPDPARYKVVGKFLTIEPLAIMLSRDDPAFKLIADEEMKRLILSGEAQALYERWFERAIPPHQANLHLPMNYLLRDFWKYPSDKVPF